MLFQSQDKKMTIICIEHTIRAVPSSRIEYCTKIPDRQDCYRTQKVSIILPKSKPR